jgi:hypothetical protein
MTIVSIKIPIPFLFITLLIVLLTISNSALSIDNDSSSTEAQSASISDTRSSDRAATKTSKVNKEANISKESNDAIELILPEQAEAGQKIKIEWKIPTAFEALIIVTNNLDNKDIDSKDVINTKTPTTNKSQDYRMEIPAYIQPIGSYELLMPSKASSAMIALQRDNKILTQKTIQLKPAKIAIQADTQIVAGTVLDLTWQAPKGLAGFINIQSIAADIDDYAQPHVRIDQRQEASMRVPTTTGDYVLRWYSQHDRQVLAQHKIKLISSDIKIIAPKQAMPGEILKLSWQAPKGLDAFINIQPSSDAQDYKASPYVYVNDDASAELELPTEAGDYTLRWYDRSDNHKILAKRVITLSGDFISIHASESVIAGQKAEISWKAPDNLDSFINIQLADQKADYNATPYIYTRGKQKEALEIPKEAGEYVLRWYNRTDHKVMAERKIKVLEIQKKE